MKVKKILIIGAGWYGCHIGLYLKEKKHNVEIHEKNKDIFLGSSGYNQFRLHLGYHYPRSSQTIEDAKKNYLSFIKRYKKFISFPKKNIYCIANQKSLIDAKTYETIIKTHKLKIEKKKIDYLMNIESSYNCNEGVLLNNKFTKYYKDKLKENLNFNSKIKNINKLRNKYDFILDCSNTLIDSKLKKFNYVLTISLIYKMKNNLNMHPLTIMDGKLPSLYPYADNKSLFTLTHAEHTHIKTFKSFKSLEKYKKNITNKKIRNIKNNIEKDMIFYYPGFKKGFNFKDYFLSYKVLPNEKSAKRTTFIQRNKNIIMCSSPKIGNIFSFQSYIEKIIN